MSNVIKEIRCRGGARLEMKCLFCKKHFIKPKSQVVRGRGKYCSRICMDSSPAVAEKRRQSMPDRRGAKNPSFKNGWTSYKRIKKIKCNRCNVSIEERPLQVHHIDGNRLNSTPDNLEVLCASCHTKEHWHRKGRKSNGWEKRARSSSGTFL